MISVQKNVYMFSGNIVILCSDNLIPFLELSGVSSFNEFIHELSVDSDTESVADSVTGDDEHEDFVCPPSPLSQSSRLSHASSFGRRDRRLRHIRYAVSWILWPLGFFLSLIFTLFNAIKFRIVRSSAKGAETPHLSRTGLARKSFHIRDQFLQRTTDRRRGVFEVVIKN